MLQKGTLEKIVIIHSRVCSIVPEGLDSVGITTVRKFARKTWRYMDLYRNGITGKLAEYAAKKYRSHRRIPDHVIAELK